MEMHGDGEAMLWVGSEPLDVHIEPAALLVVAGEQVRLDVELDALRQR
jgi:hypothetical protein